MNTDTANLPKAERLYRHYLLERIFNFQLFNNTLMSSILLNEYRNNDDFLKSADLFRDNKNTILSVLPLAASLPNVFSRHFFSLYALLHVNPHTNSYRTFWSDHDLGKDSDVMIRHVTTQKRGFSIDEWTDQFKHFINYFSEFVIPIYEWCFVGMLMEGIESNSPTNSHTKNLELAKSILEEFISENYDSFLNPIDFSIEKLCTDSVNVVAPKQKKDYFKKVFSRDIIGPLISDFFNPPIKDMNMNLATHLNPEFFKFTQGNTHNLSTKMVRELYIFLLRTNHFI